MLRSNINSGIQDIAGVLLGEHEPRFRNVDTKP